MTIGTFLVSSNSSSEPSDPPKQQLVERKKEDIWAAKECRCAIAIVTGKATVLESRR